METATIVYYFSTTARHGTVVQEVWSYKHPLMSTGVQSPITATSVEQSSQAVPASTSESSAISAPNTSTNNDVNMEIIISVPMSQAEPEFTTQSSSVLASNPSADNDVNMEPFSQAEPEFSSLSSSILAPNTCANNDVNMENIISESIETEPSNPIVDTDENTALNDEFCEGSTSQQLQVTNVTEQQSMLIIPNPRSILDSPEFIEYVSENDASDLTGIMPTVRRLTPEEQQAVTEGIAECDIYYNISNKYSNIMVNHHMDTCNTYQLPCPFWHTQCSWIDIIPRISEHIRQMHNQRIVHKKIAGYTVSISELEKLSLGFKLIQEYNGRLYFITIFSNWINIFLTVQATCENIYQHFENPKVLFVVAHNSHYRIWNGEANKICTPISQLLQKETTLIIPKYSMYENGSEVIIHLIVEVDM